MDNDIPIAASIPIDGVLSPGLYRTFTPSITEWKHGDVRERIVIPAGETTDFSSIPKTGVLGWLAKKRGFDPSAKYFIRSGKIHDMLYQALKYRHGVLPDGWYQYFNPIANQWEAAIAYQWDRQQADAVWMRISIEDGCPPSVAQEGYNWLRLFGGLHMLLH